MVIPRFCLKSMVKDALRREKRKRDQLCSYPLVGLLFADNKANTSKHLHDQP